ncbi:MAG TPA: PCYCGC motif-containing (lipo)protein [Candidatus Acidoferrum sp.]|nr:PCYCGC motif-containing (lipo)protein [Candidatus Acidoferrum sp.]
MSYFVSRLMILAPLFAAVLAAFPLCSLAPRNEKLARSEAYSRPNPVMCGMRGQEVPSGPAYHQEPPTGSLPETLAPSQFADDKVAFVAYSVAAKIRELLYQEPCYCECDRFAGHQSLLDCYTSKHGRGCAKCQAEAFFIYEQSRTGKTPAEIRQAMERGDYRKIDVQKYAADHYAEVLGSTP